MRRNWTIPFLSHWRYLASAAAVVLVLVAAATLPVQTTTAQGLSGTDIQASTDGISMVFSAQSGRDLLSLSGRVVGPDGLVFEQRIEGAALHWIPEGDLADGTYRWEAWAVTADPGAPLKALSPDTSPEIAIEHFYAPEQQQTHVASGSFQVLSAMVEDITTSSTILSAHTSAMVVTGTGVGIGTSTPAAALHVQRGNNSAEVRVQDTGAFDGQTMFNLINNGHPKFRMEDTSQGDVRWEFRTAGTQGVNESFNINKVGSGAAEMRVFAGGNVTIGGTLTQSSSRAVKDRITELEPEAVLSQLEGLSVHEWSYQRSPNERHLGPMAEDFHAVFGLGGSTKHIAPGDLAGVALAAAKALKAENDELRGRLERLEAMLLTDD